MRTVEQRFWMKVDRSGGPAACWLWLGACDGGGYGHLRVAGRMVKAHRVSFESTRGPIPIGLELDHLCRHRGCVNPGHLEPVTHLENTRRGQGPTALNSRKTHCKHGHRLDDANTYTYCRDGRQHRTCRACNRRLVMARFLRRKSERAA